MPKNEKLHRPTAVPRQWDGIVKLSNFCYSEREGGGRPQKTVALFTVTKYCMLGAVGHCNF